MSTSQLQVSWEADEPWARYTVLVKVRGARRVRRFAADKPPLKVNLEAGSVAWVAIEAELFGAGSRMSPWSDPVALPAKPPNAPGRPCVRLSPDGLSVQLTWSQPIIENPAQLHQLYYNVHLESEDGRRAEVRAGKQPSRLSPWSPKQLFRPSDDWLVRNVCRPHS